MLIQKCVKETGNNGILFPDITREYCACSHDQLFAKFDKPEYLKLIEKPIEEQIKMTKPVFENCLTEYENKLKSKQTDEWTDAEYQLAVEKCLQSSEESAIKYPEITRTYCECSRTKIIENFSKEDFKILVNEMPETLDSISIILIEDCTKQFQLDIEQAEK